MIEKMILHMWDASLLAGSINNNTIDTTTRNGNNSPAIKTIYADLQIYSREVYLVLPSIRILHHGFVATVATSAGEVPVISFRGTDGPVDGANNLLAGFKKFVDGSDVHDSFYSAAKLFFNDIYEDKIVKEAIQNNKPIYFTGHSKGAAISTLLARMISHKSPGTQLHVYTFGSPRVGGEKFAKNYENDQNINHLRVESFGDLVPHLPLTEQEFVLPNSYTDIIIGDLAPNYMHQYVSVGKYYPVNVDNTTYNKERIKPAPSKTGTSQNDLNAYYVAFKDFNRDKNIFGDKHGIYFPSYSINRRVSSRK